MKLGLKSGLPFIFNMRSLILSTISRFFNLSMKIGTTSYLP